MVSFGAETSDGQTADVRQVQPAARLSANLRLLCRTRLCEADPSPGLWPPPFSKGGRFIWSESFGCNDEIYWIPDNSNPKTWK